MSANVIAYLYVLMAFFCVTMGVRLGLDVYRNHYNHRPLRPLVAWIAAILTFQALHFLALAAVRYIRVSTGSVPAWIDGYLWVILLGFLAACIIGFYAAFRDVR